jgi:ferritin-like metal-binding protein YciE
MAPTSRESIVQRCDGILKEAQDVVGEVDDKSVLDAALISGAQAFRTAK